MHFIFAIRVLALVLAILTVVLASSLYLDPNGPSISSNLINLNENSLGTRDEELESLDAITCTFRPNKNPNLNCKMDPGHLDTLISVQVLFRHGMRTPITKYPNDPYAGSEFWNLGQGQLTGVGKQWSYRLGEFLRCRYDGYLQKTYSYSEVYCMTSELDRTMMTASTVLASLYPPTKSDSDSHVNYPTLNWQPIPCTTIPAVLDNKINPGTRSCPLYSNLSAQNVADITASLISQNENFNLFREISLATGMNVNNIYDVTFIWDTITIEHCQFGLPYPDWFSQLALKMKPIADLFFHEIVGTEQTKRLYSGPLMEQLVRNFDSQLDPGSSTDRSAKMFLFSGHDTTISALLHSLGVYNINSPPPYNAAVFIELHRSPSSDSFRGATVASQTFSDDIRLKVFYHTEPGANPSELLIPGCNPCTYDTFKSLTAKYRLDESTWEKECALPIIQ